MDPAVADWLRDFVVPDSKDAISSKEAFVRLSAWEPASQHQAYHLAYQVIGFKRVAAGLRSGAWPELVDLVDQDEIGDSGDDPFSTEKIAKLFAEEFVTPGRLAKMHAVVELKFLEKIAEQVDAATSPEELSQLIDVYNSVPPVNMDDYDPPPDDYDPPPDG